MQRCKKIKHRCDRTIDMENSCRRTAQKSQQIVKLTERERDCQGEDLHEARLSQI